MKTKLLFITIITAVALISISCIDKSSKKSSEISKDDISGEYSLEYSFKISNKYIQKGTVHPWSIIQDKNSIIVEDTATGYIEDSTLVFSGGPLNLGAGHGTANFEGRITDSTIVGNFTGTYYDPKLGTEKFSSASFVLRRIN